MRESKQPEKKAKNKIVIRLHEWLVTTILIGFALLFISSIIFILVDIETEVTINKDTADEYHTSMQAHCKGYDITECRVVKVHDQKIELEPLRLIINSTDDLDSSRYTKTELTKLKVLPKKSLKDTFIKLTLFEGYVTDLEVIGSKKELEELQRKKVKEKKQ